MHMVQVLSPEEPQTSGNEVSLRYALAQNDPCVCVLDHLYNLKGNTGATSTWLHFPSATFVHTQFNVLMVANLM
jgi:hypothetical protein